MWKTGGLQPTAGINGGRRGIAGDGGGTTKVMCHGDIVIRSDMYDFNSGQYRSQMMDLSIPYVNRDK